MVSEIHSNSSETWLMRKNRAGQSDMFVHTPGENVGPQFRSVPIARSTILSKLHTASFKFEHRRRASFLGSDITNLISWFSKATFATPAVCRTTQAPDFLP